MPKSDRRIEKTRSSIFSALSELMQEKRYTNITIQEIVDRANIGRTTFYIHFTDKDDLLSCYIETIFESLSHDLSSHTPADQENRVVPIAELFTHIQENRRLINGLLLSDSSDLLFDKFRSYWSKRLEPFILAHLKEGTKPAVPIEILTNYVTGAMIDLLRWWMKSGANYSPVQMEQYLYAMVIPGITSVLAE